MKTSHQKLLLAAALCLLGTGAYVSGEAAAPQGMRVVPVAGKVSVLNSGRGGNIGVLAGEEGVLLVDDLFANTVEEVEKAIDEISEGAPVWLINTHWHGDHTGANAHFGVGARIVAHRNVRRRLSGDAAIGGRVADPVSPPVGLPAVTYDQGLSLHFAGEEIEVFHVPGAHTDGDSVVWFRGSGVVHMGDVYFQVGYPFVDLDSGGSVQGLIAGVRTVLERVPADTKFVPGHGEVTGAEGLREYLAMLEEVVSRVQEGLEAGMSEEEILALKLTQDLDPRWGGFAFVPPDRFVQTVVASLK